MSNEKQTYLEKLEDQFQTLSLSYHRGVINGKNFYEDTSLILAIQKILAEIRAVGGSKR